MTPGLTVILSHDSPYKLGFDLYGYVLFSEVVVVDIGLCTVGCGCSTDAFLVATTKWDKTTLLWYDFEDICAAIVDEIPEFAMPESCTGVLNSESSDSPVCTRSKPTSGSTFGGTVAREFSNDEPGRLVTTH